MQDTCHCAACAECGGEELEDGLALRDYILFSAGVALFIAALIVSRIGGSGLFVAYVRIALYLAALILIGGEVILTALKNIMNLEFFDENFLMTIAAIGAFCIGEFPESIAVMLLYRIGEYLQALSIRRSRRSISDLMDVKAPFAWLNGEQVEPESVGVGAVITVLPNEKVPLDGRVISGRSSVNTSALTGESRPRIVGKDSEILAGFENLEGELTVEVTHSFDDSTVAKILDLVKNSNGKKAKSVSFITKFSKIYTPIVVAAAVLLAVIPPLLTLWSVPEFEVTWSESIHRALTLLVISCPCALVISVPLSYFGGIGGASRKGILIKGSSYLDALARVDVVVFDKTGTLTQGKLVDDALKPDAGAAVLQLRELGVKKLIMLSGDKREYAQKVAEEIGLDEFRAELLPQDKVAAVEELRREGHLVFAGDGVNDAPVLAIADVGVAMGASGTDAAIEAADVVLMTDEVSKLPAAIRIARRTRVIVTQNIVLSLGVKAVLLVLGALGVTGLWWAVFGDTGVALLAAANALRAMKQK
ncbi:MAG: HAD-IC family P-type ATPase [Oscillospiraceae bacterium]|jgi:cation transport ATPase|nr:HAD-IC family P-type ATPase [Oscillospiraceae bacterium]